MPNLGCLNWRLLGGAVLNFFGNLVKNVPIFGAFWGGAFLVLLLQVGAFFFLLVLLVPFFFFHFGFISDSPPEKAPCGNPALAVVTGVDDFDRWGKREREREVQSFPLEIDQQTPLN